MVNRIVRALVTRYSRMRRHICEVWKFRVWQSREHFSRYPAPKSHSWIAKVRAMRSGQSPQFLFNDKSLAASVLWLQNHRKAECEQILRSADRLHQGDFSQFVPVAHRPISSPPDWHLDLVTGKRWPDSWYRKIDYSSESRPGEIRHLWDLHRHLYLVRLAQAWLLRQDPRDLELLQLLFYDWWDHNPVGHGIAWIGPQIQEHAVRTTQWIFVLFLLLHHELVPEAFLADLLQAINLQTNTLAWYYNPDKSHSHNHLIAESAGLWIAASILPAGKQTTQWRTRARKGLLAALDLQLLADGQQAEFASNYHYYVLEWALLCRALATRLSDHSFDFLDDRLVKATEIALDSVLPNGRIAYIGDADDALAYFLDSDPHSHRSRIAATAGRILHRPGLLAQSLGHDSESIWLCGPETPPVSHNMSQEDSAVNYRATSNLILYKNSSKGIYFLLRGGAGVVIPRVGASHRHADCNQILLWFQGNELLSDPGTYLYNGPDNLRRLYRSTSSHSTIRVDEQDHCDVSSKRFGVYQLPEVIGSGYTNQLPLLAWSDVSLHGVAFLRQIVLLEDLLLIVDELQGEYSKLECNFIAPVELGGNHGFHLCSIDTKGQFHALESYGNEDWAGAISTRYGLQEQAYRYQSCTSSDRQFQRSCLRHVVADPKRLAVLKISSEDNTHLVYSIDSLHVLEPGAKLVRVPYSLVNKTDRLLCVNDSTCTIASPAGTMRARLPMVTDLPATGRVNCVKKDGALSFDIVR